MNAKWELDTAAWPLIVSAPDPSEEDDSTSIVALIDCRENDSGRTAHFAEQIAAKHARLIAAAPELIAALRSCADRLSVVIESDNEDHSGAAIDDIRAYDAARAAIAKATEVQS